MEKQEANQPASPSVSDALSQSLVRSADRKKRTDGVVKGIFLFIALVCASVIVFITIFVLIQGLKPFMGSYPGEKPDQTGHENLSSFFVNTTFNVPPFDYGVAYLIVNTLYVTALSCVISIPLSILTALLITRIAPRTLGAIFQTGIELLSSVPSVIFGLVGAGMINPIVLALDRAINGGATVSAAGSSILSAVLVLAFMALPTMTMMSITAIKAVDINLIKASVALGASNSQTNFKIVLKAAQSGIFAGIILGLGRALGEATAIQMVIGNASGWLRNSSNEIVVGNIFNPLAISSTLTTQMLSGMGEATVGSLNYDIRFSAGILLIILLLLIDTILNAVKNSIYNKQMGIVKVTFIDKVINAIKKKNFPKTPDTGLKK